ncbi:MAG: hypothetical protein ACTSYX_01385 [Candidatus Thorarchaeota archaeon]
MRFNSPVPLLGGQGPSVQVCPNYNQRYIVESGQWNGEAIVPTIDGLAPELHEYSLTVFDVSRNNVSDSVAIEVFPSEAPIINTPSDITYTEETTGNTILWAVSDQFPDHYELVRNGETIHSGPWNGSNIVIDVDGLDSGKYFYVLRVCETAENTAYDTILVTVLSASSTTASSATSTTATSTMTQTTASGSTSANGDILGLSPISLAITAASVIVIVMIMVNVLRQGRVHR